MVAIFCGCLKQDMLIVFGIWNTGIENSVTVI